MYLLITRPEPDAGETAERLGKLGHRVLVDPMLEIVFNTEIDVDLDGIQAIAVTSTNAVHGLVKRADCEQLLAMPVFTVGQKTAAAARSAGFKHVEAASGNVTALARLVGERLAPEAGAVFYSAGRDRVGGLEEILRSDGFDVRLVETYRADTRNSLQPSTVAALEAGDIDGILIYSARTAKALLAAAGGGHHIEMLWHVPVYAISENAAKPLVSAGFTRIVIAPKPNGDSLISCLTV